MFIRMLPLILLIVLILVLFLSADIFTQDAGGAPPPPGVPIDFGLSAAVAACLGFGYHKMKQEKEEDVFGE